MIFLLFLLAFAEVSVSSAVIDLVVNEKGETKIIEVINVSFDSAADYVKYQRAVSSNNLASWQEFLGDFPVLPVRVSKMEDLTILPSPAIYRSALRKGRGSITLSFSIPTSLFTRKRISSRVVRYTMNTSLLNLPRKGEDVMLLGKNVVLRITTPVTAYSNIPPEAVEGNTYIWTNTIFSNFVFYFDITLSPVEEAQETIAQLYSSFMKRIANDAFYLLLFILINFIAFEGAIKRVRHHVQV